MYEKELKQSWSKITLQRKCQNCDLDAVWSQAFINDGLPLYGKLYCDECSIRFGRPKYTDQELLDWLQSQTKGYGNGWVCRVSNTGRGMRLHETTGTLDEIESDVISKNVREAIIKAMEKRGQNPLRE